MNEAKHPRDMDVSEAKSAARREWSDKATRYSLGPDDAFTDGFWDGRAWALARLLDLIPEDQREAAASRLSIYPRERDAIGMQPIDQEQRSTP